MIAAILALALPYLVLAPPDQAGTGLDAAAAAYRDGRFAEAFQAFSALAAAEPDRARAAVLHANAGTAAARAEQPGEAFWHLREALRHAPRDAVTRRNLGLLQQRLGVAGAPAPDLRSTLAALPLLLSEDEARQALGLLVSLAVAGLAAARLRERVPRAALWAPGLALALAAAWAALDHLARETHRSQAVVLASQAVLGEPDPAGKVLFRLDAGALVQHEETRGGWTLIETSAGGRGWLPATTLRLPGG